MKKLVLPVLTALLLSVVALMGVETPVYAQESRDQICKVTLNNEAATFVDGIGCTTDGTAAGAPDGLFDGPFKAITNTLIFLVGAISVIMLIIGGLRYVVSAGDANAISGAKNTILYAIVGLIVAFLAFSIVNFVLARI